MSVTNKTIDLSVCIVNYNVSDKIDLLLTALEAELQGISHEILLVDNASSDGILEVIARHPSTLFIRNEKNRYFTAADNQNLARAKGRYIVSLNPDTVPQPGALIRLRRTFEERPEVGAVTPKCVFPDGRNQLCLGHFPWLGFGVMEAAGLNLALPWNRINKTMWPDSLDYDPDTEQDAEILYGACIMVRREMLENVGLKDEHLVHGWDEYDWCRRITLAGWKMRYVPEALVTHFQGTSRPHQKEWVLDTYHRQGLFYLYRKHYGLLAFLLVRSLYALRPLIMSRPVVGFISRALKWKECRFPMRAFGK